MRPWPIFQLTSFGYGGKIIQSHKVESLESKD